MVVWVNNAAGGNVCRSAIPAWRVWIRIFNRLAPKDNSTNNWMGPISFIISRFSLPSIRRDKKEDDEIYYLTNRWWQRRSLALAGVPQLQRWINL